METFSVALMIEDKEIDRMDFEVGTADEAVVKTCLASDKLGGALVGLEMTGHEYTGKEVVVAVKQVGISLEMQMLDDEPEEDKDGVTTTQIDPEELKKDKDAWKKHLAEIKKRKAEEAARRRKARDKLLAEVLSEEGEAALEAMNPLALQAKLVEGTNPNDPQILLKKCVSVRLVVNPVFDAVMHKLGAFRRGKRSYSFFANSDVSQDNFKGILKALPSDITYPEPAWEGANLGKKGGHKSNHTFHTRSLLHETSLGKQIGFEMTGPINADAGHYSHEGRQHAAIVLGRQNNELTFKVVTQKNAKSGEVQLYDNAPNLNTMRDKDLHAGQLVTPTVALSLIGEAEAQDIRTVVDPRIRGLQDFADDATLVRSIPGKPGKAEVLLGKNATAAHPDLRDVPGGWGARSVTLPAKDAVKMLKGHEGQLVDEDVEDVLAMENAPVVELDGLMPHQNEAVAIHLATKKGFLNAMDPGMGKTPTTLTGFQQKAQRKEGGDKPYRALVSAETSQVNQWRDESAKFFPGAQVFVLKSNAGLPKLLSKLDEHAEADPAYPLMVVLTHGSVKGALPILMTRRWDDVVIDEASFLKNRGTSRSEAIWELREAADCAIALTGTPIDKGLDDMGALISWARNDTSLFSGSKLSDYDITDEEQLQEMAAAMGPALFRRDNSLMEGKIPKMKTFVMPFDPHASEQALFNGARTELKKILEENEKLMQEAIDAASASGEITEEEKEEAQAAMKSLRGASMGAMMFNRQIGSDVKNAETSESIAAALMDEKGLVGPAVQNGGTKRAGISDYVKKRVEAGKPAIVFTEFIPSMSVLQEEFEDEGLTVAVITGEQSAETRTQNQQSFQGVPCEEHFRRPGALKECPHCTQPTADVLIATRAGTKGVNLQRGATQVHYDMSWVPSDFSQRVGRSRRFGSDEEEVEVAIAMMKGTMEERVFGLLIPRAMQSMMALDGARGVDISHSSLSGLSKGVSEVLSEEQTSGENASIFKMAKELVLND